MPGACALAAAAAIAVARVRSSRHWAAPTWVLRPHGFLVFGVAPRGAGRNLDWNLPVPVLDFVVDVDYIRSSQGGKVIFTATTAIGYTTAHPARRLWCWWRVGTRGLGDEHICRKYGAAH